MSSTCSHETRYKVLIIDDETAFRELLRLYLDELGVTVQEAGDGASALAALDEERPDLVILDVQLPDISGLEICRMLRARTETALIPVVLSTGLAATEDRILGLEAGATDFFTKPIRRTEFLVRIRNLLELHATRQALESARIAIERARTERLRAAFKHYLAPDLVEQLLKGQISGGEDLLLQRRRCWIVATFADLRGFTRMSETIDATAVVDLLNEFFTVLVARVHSHGGTAISMAGDCLMAAFGIPLPLPDAAERALLAAVGMMADFRPIAEDWTARFGVTTGLGIGVASGEVVAGNIGSPEFMNYTAIGDVVNVAARLKDRARAGEVLFTPSLLRDIKREDLLVNVLPLGSIALKGKARPLEIYCLPAHDRIQTS